MMESLLCNEVWLTMSPSLEHDKVHANEVQEYYNVIGSHHSTTGFFYSNAEDCEQFFISFLEKEVSYMPERGYVKHIKENSLTDSGRLKAINWFLKSQRRLNLSLETVFNAANYLDRFTSVKKCQVWNDCMSELVSVACLSIASKFDETNPPYVLNEIQLEGLEHSFKSSLIQGMELILLKALEWRLCPTTPYSYIELLTWSIDPPNKHRVRDLITELLVKALLDSSFLEFRPCVIAMSAMQCVSKKFLSTINDSLCTHFSALIPADQKDDIIKCCKMMMDQCNISTSAKKSCINCPSSPVTVLATHCCYDFCDCQTDSSWLTMKSLDCNMRKKRKR